MLASKWCRACCDIGFLESQYGFFGDYLPRCKADRCIKNRHFSDGFKIDCLTLEGAMRAISSRHRVRRGDLITDTAEEKIVVWLYSDEISIAEVFCERRSNS